jgi:hypothetical protein
LPNYRILTPLFSALARRRRLPDFDASKKRRPHSENSKQNQVKTAASEMGSWDQEEHHLEEQEAHAVAASETDSWFHRPLVGFHDACVTPKFIARRWR